MKSTFKIGDEVLYQGERAFVVRPSPHHSMIIERSTEGWARDCSIPDEWVSRLTNRYWYVGQQALTSARKAKMPAAPKFILQYKSGLADVLKPIATQKDLRLQIAALADINNVDRDSIRVHDIKRTRTVTLGVKITIK